MAKNDQKYVYVERPVLSETFADSMERFQFHKNLVRFELCCDRLENVNPPNVPIPRRHPIARLVITLECAIDLHNKLTMLFAALEQKGMLRRENTGTFSAPGSDTKQ